MIQANVPSTVFMLSVVNTTLYNQKKKKLKKNSKVKNLKKLKKVKNKVKNSKAARPQ